MFYVALGAMLLKVLLHRVASALCATPSLPLDQPPDTPAKLRADLLLALIGSVGFAVPVGLYTFTGLPADAIEREIIEIVLAADSSSPLATQVAVATFQSSAGGGLVCAVGAAGCAIAAALISATLVRDLNDAPCRRGRRDKLHSANVSI